MTEGALTLLFIFMAILLLPFVFDLVMGHRLGEALFELYLSQMPGWLILLCIIGGVFSWLGYEVSRIKRPAVLTISQDILHFKGKQIDLVIPIERIKKIYFNDLKNVFREPKGVMQVGVKQKNGPILFSY